MPDTPKRLREPTPRMEATPSYVHPFAKDVEGWRKMFPLQSPEEIEEYNKKWEGKPNPAMPKDRTDRFSNPYRVHLKPPDWDEEQRGLWDPHGGGGYVPGQNPYVPQLGREMPEGKEGYFNPWADPPPTKENLDRILRGEAPTPAEKFIRQNSNMTNQ